jgi:hypothetical protein
VMQFGDSIASISQPLSDTWYRPCCTAI